MEGKLGRLDRLVSESALELVFEGVRERKRGNANLSRKLV